jgi:hypothetical protein
MKTQHGLILILFALLAGQSAHAVSLSYTGAEITQDPDFIYYNQTPSVSGTSAIWGQGSGNRDKLFEYELFEANELNPSIPTTITVNMNLTRLTADWDARFGLSDGSHIIVAGMGDNDGGHANVGVYDDHGAYGTVDYGYNLFQNAGYPQIGEAVDVTIQYIIDDTATFASVSYLGSTGSYEMPALDLSNSISFAFMRDNEYYEMYQVNYFGLEAVSAVMEPSSAVLLGFGLFLFLVTNLSSQILPISTFNNFLNRNKDFRIRP